MSEARAAALRLFGASSRELIVLRSDPIGWAAEALPHTLAELAMVDGRALGRRGMLSPGMDADLVVLTTDPIGQPAEALLDSSVGLTMVGGRSTYEGASA